MSFDPGDVLVVRSIGNLVAPWNPAGFSSSQSEAAAIEFAVDHLEVSNIIVCGHSGCGAMAAALSGMAKPLPPDLAEWLKLAQPALEALHEGADGEPERPTVDRLSQLNVLAQIENVESYPSVRAAVERRALAVNGLWLDIAADEVLVYERAKRSFTAVDRA